MISIFEVVGGFAQVFAAWWAAEFRRCLITQAAFELGNVLGLKDL